MKILELTRSFHPSIGGMEKFVSDRLEIYHALEHDYQVITTTHSEKILNNSEKLDTVKYLPSYTPYEISPNLNRAMNLEYDVLSVNQVGYYYSDFAINRAHKQGKRIIVTPHFYFHTDRFKLFKRFHSTYVLPRIFQKVHRIICFTKYEANFWINKFPHTENKISIIPHYFKWLPVHSESTRNDYGDYFLYLGRGEKNKRIDLLITAFDKMQTNTQLILTINIDEISSSLNEIIKKNGRIHLLGRVSEEEKHQLLTNCIAVVLPSDYEAFGIVNLEASYYKKPLILSELEVFSGILNRDGIIYFKNNLKSIEVAIRKIITMGNEGRSIMGEKNYLNLKNYSFELVSKKYARLFDELF